MEYRMLKQEEISQELFRGFQRRQEVTKCWRKADGQWILKDAPFVDQWSPEEYAELVTELKTILQEGGAVFAAFDGRRLKGFTSVAGQPMGSRGQYRDMTQLHVSEEARHLGIGRRLFLLAREWARENGGEKLYLSAHSAQETQAFYRAMGCVEAEEYQQEHVKKEPFDCQMECLLK